MSGRQNKIEVECKRMIKTFNYKCCCGGSYSVDSSTGNKHKIRHETKSKKHKKYILSGGVIDEPRLYCVDDKELTEIKQITSCACGGKYRTGNKIGEADKRRHEQTARHTRFLEQAELELENSEIEELEREFKLLLSQ